MDTEVFTEEALVTVSLATHISTVDLALIMQGFTVLIMGLIIILTIMEIITILPTESPILMAEGLHTLIM